MIEKLINFIVVILILLFFLEGKYFVVGNLFGKIVVYIIGLWEVVIDRWFFYMVRVLSIVWNKVGMYVVLGGLDMNVFVWSLVKLGSRVKVVNVYKDGVYGVVFVEGDEKVVSLGGDVVVKVWNVKNL